MGFFSKVFKGIKKVAKKIGKGIKKIGKKLFGAIGKIGPLGQLALMFIGVPPIFGKMMGAVGSFVQSVAPNVYKAFTAIKGAAQGAYNSITQGIGNGIDRVMNFTQGKGFNLTEGRTSIFASAKPTVDPLSKAVSLDPKDIVADSKAGVLDVTKTTADLPIEFQTVDSSVASLKDVAPQQTLKDVATNVSTDLSMGAPDLADVARDTIMQGPPDSLLSPSKTFGEKTKDFIFEQFDTFKETVSDPGKLAGEAVKGGVMSGISSKVAMDIAGAPPTQKVMHSQLSDFIMPITNQQRLLDSTTWTGINNSYQQAGAYGGAAQGDVLSMYYNNQFANDKQYQQDMRRLGAFTL